MPNNDYRSRQVATSQSRFEGKFKRNEYIRSSTVRVIDEQGENLGELKTAEAIALAGEKGLDLIEISPTANPPVCKIMAWDKFQFQQQKKGKQNKKKKEKRLKEFRFKAGIGEQDEARKIKRAKEFLTKGHAVKITLIPTHRVIKTSIKEIFDDLLTNFEGYSRITDVQKGARKISVTFKLKKGDKIKEINNKEVSQNQTDGGQEPESETD